VRNTRGDLSVCPKDVKDYHRREAAEKKRQKSADGIVVTSVLGTKAGTCRNEEGLKSHRTKETQKG
jgi:hypothetical protein